MKSLTPDEFFKEVSINSRISDLRIIRDIYYGVVRTITRELKGRHKIQLPDLGEFNLKIHKARKFVSVRGKAGFLPAKPTIKFVANRNVKQYFYTLGESGTVIQS